MERARAGEPALLIGDAAIERRRLCAARNASDFGEALARMDRSETVFAVWAARRDAFDRDPARWALHARVSEAYAWSRAHRMRVVDLAQR